MAAAAREREPLERGSQERLELEAFAFRKLVEHLRANAAAVQVSAAGARPRAGRTMVC
jgi:hypothetical protein